MQLFDTHFHFYGDVTPQEYCSNIKLAIEQSQTDVERLFLNAVGANFGESLKAQSFASATDDCIFSCGVHPHSAEEYLADRADFSVFRNDSKLAAVGELGLDYFYDYSDKRAQISVFEEFLALALDWKLPAIVHIRDKETVFDAYSDAYQILSDFSASGGRFVVHCFAGNPFWAEKFLALGAFCGVTGMVTFKKAENIRENLKTIPLDRLLIETDSPYLAPIPHRGKENHPGYLVYVALEAAKQYDIPAEQFAETTTANGKKFFGIC
ncbi:MAG: TatD family hydrolase [Lentisphaeria bacterium]|nr:TatD family hydrolase [Lentisphaeria bacterium]